MKNLTYLIILIITSNNILSENLKIISPENYQDFCGNKNLSIKWTGDAMEYLIEARTALMTEYIAIQDYSIQNNTLIWNIYGSEYFNIPLTIRISDKNNLSKFDELKEIIIFDENKIINQTKSITVCLDENVNIRVDAVGYNLTYRWFKDGEELIGENKNNLTFSHIQYNQSGVYECLIESGGRCQTLRSNPIPVYVITKTKFIEKPHDFHFGQYELATKENLNGKLEAKIHVNYNEELNNIKFQWWKDTIGLIPFPGGGGYFTLLRFSKRIKVIDDGRIIGSNTQLLQIRDMNWGDRSNYYCIATGPCGSDTTKCYIGDDTHFTIKNNFLKFDGCEGDDVTLKVTVNQKNRGKIVYQWYKVGVGEIYDNEKYVGCNTAEMTIRNISATADNTIFYCIVTLLGYNVSQFSEEFAVEPSKIPRIVIQPQSTIIKDKTNRHYPETYIDVIVENNFGCLYTWYRNGVQARKTCWLSDYWLGVDSCPPPNKMPTPRPPKKEDVGWYKCKIENKCGTIWSDSAYISWGYDDIMSCKGTDVDLVVDDFGSDFEYYWEKEKKIINESSRFKNVNSNHLNILNLQANDQGYYFAYIKNKNTSESSLVGKILVEVKLAPIILKDFPKELVNDGLYMKQAVISVETLGPLFYHQLFIDGEPAYPLQAKEVPNYLEKTHPFILGGYNSNLKPGIYKMYFKNECGEVWSSELKVVNTAYKPKGIPIEEDKNTPTDIITDYNVINVSIFPNPASDYIEISCGSIGASSNDNGASPIASVQIFNTLGIEVISTPSASQPPLNEGNLRIDISHLPAGVYFVRISGCNGACSIVEKFVKM